MQMVVTYARLLQSFSLLTYILCEFWKLSSLLVFHIPLIMKYTKMCIEICGWNSSCQWIQSVCIWKTFESSFFGCFIKHPHSWNTNRQFFSLRAHLFCWVMNSSQPLQRPCLTQPRAFINFGLTESHILLHYCNRKHCLSVHHLFCFVYVKPQDFWPHCDFGHPKWQNKMICQARLTRESTQSGEPR